MSQTKEVTSDAPFRNCSKNVSSHAITLGIGCLENLHHARNASEYAAPAPIELALQWWAAPNREIRVGEAGIPQSNDDDRHESRHCEAQATMPSPPQFTPPQFVEPDVQDTRDQFEAGVLPSVLASARVRGEGFDKGFRPRAVRPEIETKRWSKTLDPTLVSPVRRIGFPINNQRKNAFSAA